MTRKIDSVLDRVKYPESNLPIAQLGVVKRLRYNEEKKALYIFTDFYNHLPKCVTCAAIAKASGVTLDSDVAAARTLAFIDSSEPGIKPSMQRDVEAGKPSELESMIGAAVRLGIKHNVPTPVMRFAYALLKPRELHCASSKNK